MPPISSDLRWGKAHDGRQMRYWKKRYEPIADTAAVTLNMLFEHLETLGFRIVSKPARNARFDRVATTDRTDETGACRPHDAVDPTLSRFPALRVCDARTALNLGGKAPACVLALAFEDLGDEELGAIAEEAAAHSCTAVVAAPRGNATVESLRGSILAFLLSIRELTSRLERASSTAGSFQKLLDIGEEFFGCFMNVTDANYVLLARSTHINPQDEINTSLVKLGYHAEAHLRLQRSTGYLLENIAEQTGVQVHPPAGPFPYTLITSVMRVDGQYAGHVLMACDEADVTPGTVDSFSLFASYCERLARKKTAALPMQNPPAQALLLRLVAEKNVDGIFLREQAEQLKIPTTDIFALALFDYEPALRSQLAYFAAALDKQVETPHVAFSIGSSIAILLYGDTEDALWNAITRARETHSSGVRPQAYVSDAFYRLSGIYCGYRQIAAIRKYERDIRLCLALTDSEGRADALCFRDAFCFYWEDTLADEEIRHFSLAHLLVSSIARNDEKRGTDDLALLFTFLANERKATLVGSKCHLHRNGVLYRISKMAHEYGFDLDDYLTRQYLQVSIRIKLAASAEFSSLLENARILYAEEGASER